MPFPNDCDDLRALVNVMRELGVVQAFGVLLGPVPSKAEPEPTSDAKTRAEHARQVQREESLDALRWRLPNISEADLAQFLPEGLR